MPLLNNCVANVPARYQPIVSLTYNKKARGFDLHCRKGHAALMSWLSIYGQPLVVRSDKWEYFVPEIYFEGMMAMAKACYFQPSPELAQFYLPEEYKRGDPPLTTVGGTSLRHYQVSAVRRLIQGSLLLGDDMGLGKTLSVLHAWLNLPDRPGLVVVLPNDDVAGDWMKCNSEHFNGWIQMHLITSRNCLKKIGDPGTVVLVPYSKVWRDDYYQALLQRAPGCVLVFDEAHRVSRSSSKQHSGCYALAQAALMVWCLSGTEVSNTPDQYYGMYRIVQQPVYTDYPFAEPQGLTEKAWIKFFRDTTQRNQWNEKNLASLKVLRQGFALRRTKEEVQKDLPPLTIITHLCTMDPITRKIYRDLEKDCEAELIRQGNPEILKEDHFWTIYLRLIQLCSHPLLLGEERVPVPSKWDRLEDILAECSGSQQVGIWSNFPNTIEWLGNKIREHFPWLTVETAHGGVSKEDRARIKTGIQEGEVDVVIANPAIWGEGVNLQAISCGVYWDHHPSLVRRKQSQSRFHRMGQTKPVTLYDLAYRDSVDVRLLEWLSEKGKLARLITG